MLGMITEIKPIPWKLAGIWNAAAMKDSRPLKARNYIYASELGQPLYDRYLKMKAVPFTNPPNDRSRRKFLAGNLFEFITKQILVATGIYHQEEIKIDEQPYPKGLEVHGRCDFVAGGLINQAVALERLDLLVLPDYLQELGKKLIEEFSGKDLERIILELKAVSSFAFDRVLAINRALPNNSLQGYHYQRNGNLRAEVSYLCKDDMRMAQFGLNPDEIEPLYEDDILNVLQEGQNASP
jgi:hypothetical protein